MGKVIGWILFVALGGEALAGTVLGVRGGRFTINDKPVFLLGISYYGALGAPKQFIQRDLADMQRYGFNWLRVWATWAAFGENVSVVDAKGMPRKPYLRKLQSLVAACDRRGLIVDVTLSRGDGANGAPGLQSLTDYTQAVATLARALRKDRNWYLDLGNERNIRDKRFISFTALRQARDTAKRIMPTLLTTASHAGGDLSRRDLRRYLNEVHLDFIAPHRPRDAASPAQTEAVTRQLRKWMTELGRVVPILYQEPFRRGYSRWQPVAHDYFTDLRGALVGGAAGWCFHNGDQRNGPKNQPRRSFDLRRQRLFDQLDSVERVVIRGVGQVVASSKVPEPLKESKPTTH